MKNKFSTDLKHKISYFTFIPSVQFSPSILINLIQKWYICTVMQNERNCQHFRWQSSRLENFYALATLRVFLFFPRIFFCMQRKGLPTFTFFSSLLWPFHFSQPLETDTFLLSTCIHWYDFSSYPFKSLTQPIGTHSSYFNDEMSSFAGLPPLEMEPLPSLFPFSPCGSAGYPRPERPTHDVADVLLSLKNAVLKPGAESLSCQTLQTAQNYGTSPNGLSYTVHHPQILLSPSPHHHYYQCHQNQAQNGYSSNGYYETSPSCSGHYPSMSVNVSMNMTMHGYSEGPCPQVKPPNLSQSQWKINFISSRSNGTHLSHHLQYSARHPLVLHLHTQAQPIPSPLISVRQEVIRVTMEL